MPPEFSMTTVPRFRRLVPAVQLDGLAVLVLQLAPYDFESRSSGSLCGKARYDHQGGQKNYWSNHNGFSRVEMT
jgi:hypothetical protein